MSVGGVDLGSARGRIVIDVDDAIRDIGRVDKALNSAGQMGVQGLGGLTKQTGAMTTVFGGLGAAVGGFFASSIGSAAGFEQAMDGVAASLGGVGTASGITEAQFQALNDEALRIGATTSKSAGEAAGAMDLLAKAGVDVNTILNGGAQAAVNVSEATGESLNQSATTMAAVMTLFKDTGITAEQAADMITTGMNSSSASMTEFQTGIGNLAPVVAATGMSFDQTASLIAYFNSQGLNAAEVGTSLTSAFNALINPTSDAAIKMDELGISAFDANEQFIGFPALFDQVAQATAGMTEEQAAASLELIFGADAADVMALAMKNGGDPVRALTSDMNESGTAAESAATRMDNLKGDIEGLSGAVDTLRIKIGDKLLPVLRELTQLATKLIAGIGKLPDSVLNVALAFGGLLAVFGTLSTGGALAAMIPGFSGIAAVLGGLALPLTIAAAAVGIFALAWKTNFGGFGDFANGVIDDIKNVKKQFNALYGGFAGQSARDAVLGITEDYVGADGALRAVGQALFLVTGIDARKFFNQLGKSITRFPKAFKKMGAGLDHISDTFKDKGFKAGISDIFGYGGQKMLRGFGDALGAVPKLIGEVFTGLKTGIEPVDRLLNQVGRGFIDFGRLIQELGQGDFGGALVVFDRLINRFGKIAGALFDVLLAGIQAIPWGTVWDFAVSAITAAASAGIAIGTVLISAGIKLIGGITGAVGDLYGWIKRQLFGIGGGGAAITAGGGGGPSGGGVASQENAISFGDVLIEAGVRLIGGITSALGRLSDWVKELLVGRGGGGAAITAGGAGGAVGGGLTVPIGTVLIQGLAALASGLWGTLASASEWFRSKIEPVSVDDVKVTLSATFSSDGSIWLTAYTALKNWVLSAPYSLSPDVKLNLEESSFDITTDLLNAIDIRDIAFGIGIASMIGAAIMLAPLVIPLTFGYKFGVAILQAITAVSFGIGKAIGLKIGEIVANATIYIGFLTLDILGLGIRFMFNMKDKIQSVIDLFRDLSFPLQALTLSIVSPSVLLGFGAANLIGWILAYIAEWGDINVPVHTIMVIAAPAISLAFGLEDLVGWIGDKVKALGKPSIPVDVDLIPDISLPGQNFADSDVLNNLRGKNGPADAAANMANAGNQLGGAGGGWALPPLDLAAFNSSISDAKDALTSFTADPYKAFLAADYTAVDQASQVAWLLGGAWADSVHTGKFNGDPSNADKASQAAWLLGQNWDGRVFTAKFDVDTTGITNAVLIARQAAADIAAVMPHSPADEGPLRRPITFDYIAENMRRAMNLVTGYAYTGASSVASYLGGAAGYLNAVNPATYASTIPNRGVVNNYVDNRKFYALKTAELVRMMNQAENGDRLWQAAQSVEFS